MARTVCVSCNGSGAKRPCPALGGMICGPCCGSKRHSSIRCAAECPHNPFGVDNYDEWLRLDASWGDKCVKYIAAHCPLDEYSFKKELAGYVLFEGSVEEEVLLDAAPLWIHARLFWEPYRDGMPLADCWEREGWQGLNNDERTMMALRRETYPVILEIQEKIDDTAMRCVDLLDLEKKPFTVFDRSMAARCSRFLRSVNLVCAYPHYFRSGPSGLELQHELTGPFLEEMEARSAEVGVPVRDYLRGHFVEACRLVHRMGIRRMESMLDSLDMSEWRAVYGLNIPRDAVAKVLSTKPDFEPEESATDGVAEYTWLRRGESKKLEKKMPAFFRHGDDEDAGVGTVGRLRLSDDTVEIIAFGKQKFRFARKMLEKYLGACIAFQSETETDLKEGLRQSLQDGPLQRSESPIDGSPEGESEIPPEARAGILRGFHQQHYRQFLDAPVPMLEDKTPLQAARNKKLRPKLVDLMKLHIQGIEKRNLEDPHLGLDIDWVLDALGLEELKSGSGK